MSSPVRSRDRIAILKALRAGVAPPRGLEHIQVGRIREVTALSEDIAYVKTGGGTVRFVVGDYGTGKSFFLQVMRQAAQRAGCVTMNADLSQNARLYGTGGKVRALYSALVSSAATKSQPEGGALLEVLERFAEKCQRTAADEGRDLVRVTREHLFVLRKYDLGATFADVVTAYVVASRDGDELKRNTCLRWFRAEFRLKSEPKSILGVADIIDDSNMYPALRIFARFVRLAGYGGLVVGLDEVAVLLRLQRSQRDQNYEEILTIVNGAHRGLAEGLGFVFAGTNELLDDKVRGIASYAALRERLRRSPMLKPGMVDMESPTFELPAFTVEDLVVLMENVHRVYTSNGQRDPLPDEKPMLAFLEHATGSLGGIEFVSARELTKEFVQFLDILDQNRAYSWRDVLDDVEVAPDEEQQDTSEIDDAVQDATVPFITPQAGSADELDGFSLAN